MVATLGPAWHAGLVGTHTYNVDCGIEVVDGRRTMSRNGTYRSSLNRRFGQARDQLEKGPHVFVVASAIMTLADLGTT